MPPPTATRHRLLLAINALRILVLEELANGSVAIPCGNAVTVDQGHYLCFRAERMELPVLAAFRTWVLAQAQAELPVLKNNWSTRVQKFSTAVA
jgi:hypothetical protein